MIFLKGQLFVLFFLLKFVYSRATSPILQSIVSRSVLENEFNCLFWIKSKSELYDILDENRNVQIINLKSEATSEMAAASLKTLHVRHEQTMILVDEPDKISRLSYLASNLRQILILVDDKKPPLLALSMINAPLVWMQSSEDGVRH